MPMMSATLPRVWDHLPEGGLAEPVRATREWGTAQLCALTRTGAARQDTRLQAGCM